MRQVVATVTAIRFALSPRRDLVLELLALHHQVAVLARSNRRFRSSDRLLWLILRRTSRAPPKSVGVQPTHGVRAAGRFVTLAPVQLQSSTA
jgi:hypothetical protein